MATDADITELDKRSEEYAKTATPYTWQRTAIAVIFREVYSLVIADAAKVVMDLRFESNSADAKEFAVKAAKRIDALASPARGGTEASKSGE